MRFGSTCKCHDVMGQLIVALTQCRDMLEEIMDDEEEVQQINLSSRPLREEQRKQRDRQRLEREMERQVASPSGQLSLGPPV